MKRYFITLFIFVLPLLAQQKQDVSSTKELHIVPSAIVEQVKNASVTPAIAGSRTLYYWLVSIDASGNKSLPSGAFIITNAQSTITSRYYNYIQWKPVSGAVAYDVLRTSTVTTPSGNCNCAVATNLPASNWKDVVEVLQAYTVSTNNKDFIVTNEIVDGKQKQITRYNGNDVLTLDENGIEFSSQDVSFNNIITSKLNGTVVVDGNKYPFTEAGIQAAINDTPESGKCFLTPAIYSVCDSITINKSIILEGSGDSSYLNVCSTLAATKDVFVVSPTTPFLFNLQMRNFMINPQSGTPGRHGIYFDGTVGTVDNANISHVRIGKLGSTAISASGTGGGNGIPRISRIEDNLLSGGINFPNAGDTVVISHNHLDSAGKAIDIDFQSGASTAIIDTNNVVSLGGIRIGSSSVATKIINNEFETIAGFVGSNGAFLDIDGTAGNPADVTVIKNNSFQIVNGITTNGVRVNNAVSTFIEGNRFKRGAGASKDIEVTANASKTYIGVNTWIDGLPITSMLSDASNSSIYHFPINDEFVLKNNTSFLQLDETGTQRGIFRTTNDGTVFYYGFHGTPIVQAGDGITNLFDGAGNIAGVLGGGYSSSIVNSRFATFPNTKVNGLRIDTQKATTGKRYLCIDTNGDISSSAAACSGT